MEGLWILPRVKELLSGRSWIWTQVYLVPKIHSASYLPKCQRSGEGWSVDSKTPTLPPRCPQGFQTFPCTDCFLDPRGGAGSGGEDCVKPGPY